MTERKPKKKKKSPADYRKRKHTCTFYLSADEHAALERVTAARECSAAAFFRGAILRADSGLRAATPPRTAQSIVIDPRQLVIKTA
jgi:hypothetical protein